MKSLYEITQDYLSALDGLQVDEETGEILNIETLEEVSADFEKKAEAVACYIKNLNAFTVALKSEEEALSVRRKAAEKKAENLKKYLASCLETAGMTKLETPKAKLSFRKSSSVQICDPDLIPSEFKEIIQQTRISKAEIKKAIQAEQTVPGAYLQETKNLQVG
ncbi:MAG TPA: siphovirus Gp157 family protein [Clostridiales bacterium]|nr:siphovirus Gp157 family protein [Clostridiales bacterium]